MMIEMAGSLLPLSITPVNVAPGASWALVALFVLMT
jgi:hypothetical protein